MQGHVQPNGFTQAHSCPAVRHVTNNSTTTTTTNGWLIPDGGESFQPYRTHPDPLVNPWRECLWTLWTSCIHKEGLSYNRLRSCD